VAVPLPIALRERLARWVAAVRSTHDLDAEWRWTDPEGWHLTLAFLGATQPDAAAAILDRLARVLAETDGFAVVAGGLGSFPSHRQARVLWYGVQDGDGRLAELAARVRVASGTQDETRFRPHVTLARARDRLGATVPLLPLDTLPAGEVPVAGVALMRSHLGAGPAPNESIGVVPRRRAPVGAPARASRSLPLAHRTWR
jgi:2'-5' RNA ligase